MSLPVVMTRSAIADVEAADEWWQTQRPLVMTAIRDELAKAAALLSSYPELGARVPGAPTVGTRRWVIRAIRYALYYRVVDDRVEILRFWHTSRGSRPAW